MVHAFHIDEGQVSYRNRWIRTQQWQLENDAGRALFSTSGDPRAHDPAVLGLHTDGVANTNIIWHANRLLCLEEGHGPIEIDPITLSTRGPYDFSGGLPSNLTAHPKTDAVTGELIGFANYPSGKFNGDVAYYVFDAAGELTQSQTIRMPYSGLIHDFAITANFIVFIVCPLTISIQRAMSGGPPMAWEPDKPVHVGVIPRQNKEQDRAPNVQWFERDACFSWHTLNAWDSNGTITIDLCEQAAPGFPQLDGKMPAPELNPTYLTRWELSLTGRSEICSTRLAELVVEYPRFDERYATRPLKHAYFACGGGLGTADIFHHQISHFEFDTGQMYCFDFGQTCAVHEPIFAPRTTGADEGDGYLLTVVYDEVTDFSRLVVFDALQISAGPIATALVPHRVPIGFHGAWCPWN